jgi:hypothetical protein
MNKHVPKVAKKESTGPLWVIWSFIKFNIFYAALAIGYTNLMLHPHPETGEGGGGIGYAFLILIMYAPFLFSWLVWIMICLWSNRRQKP